MLPGKSESGSVVRLRCLQVSHLATVYSRKRWRRVRARRYRRDRFDLVATRSQSRRHRIVQFSKSPATTLDRLPATPGQTPVRSTRERCHAREFSLADAIHKAKPGRESICESRNRSPRCADSAAGRVFRARQKPDPQLRQADGAVLLDPAQADIVCGAARRIVSECHAAACPRQSLVNRGRLRCGARVSRRGPQKIYRRSCHTCSAHWRYERNLVRSVGPTWRANLHS